MEHLKKAGLAIVMLVSISSYSQTSLSTMPNSNEDHSEFNSNTSQVIAETIITDSQTIEGYKNLEFKLSNGLSFTYDDGNCKAGYNNRSLDVKGKYSVTCEAGTLSLAFNPDDGSIWWVFKPNI